MSEDDPYLDLAPLDLPNYRVRRYHGDDLCLPLSAFSPDDAATLRTLYTFLEELLAVLAPDQGSGAAGLPKLLRMKPTDDLVTLVTGFGRSSWAANSTPQMAKTIHDVRGGGLTPLLGELQLIQSFGLDEARLNALYFLTRDHLKIMRNALLGLDDAKRQADLLPKIHGTDFIVQKWQGALLHAQGRSIRLEVDCAQPTAISECCVEFGALDRILYNLINNACRHAAAEVIRLILLPVPTADGENLRFILLNSVSTQDLEYLRSIQLSTLFEEGTSTTGSGYGLSIAGDFVSHAYGLKSQSQAVQKGYLGARVIGDSFAAWFHWPRILED